MFSSTLFTHLLATVLVLLGLQIGLDKMGGGWVYWIGLAVIRYPSQSSSTIRTERQEKGR